MRLSVRLRSSRFAAAAVEERAFFRPRAMTNKALPGRHVTALPFGAPPEGRRDVYRLLSDNRYERVGNRDHELQQSAKVSPAGVDVLGADTRAGRRLEETARFFEFLIDEMPCVLERWRDEARDG